LKHFFFRISFCIFRNEEVEEGVLGEGEILKEREFLIIYGR